MPDPQVLWGRELKEEVKSLSDNQRDIVRSMETIAETQKEINKHIQEFRSYFPVFHFVKWAATCFALVAVGGVTYAIWEFSFLDSTVRQHTSALANLDKRTEAQTVELKRVAHQLELLNQKLTFAVKHLPAPTNPDQLTKHLTLQQRMLVEIEMTIQD